MDYIGLLSEYKIDRPLTDEERSHQLKQDKKLDAEPLYQLSVIRMNSTYLEIVDKFYAWKGLLTSFTLFLGTALFWFGLHSLLTLPQLLDTVYSANKVEFLLGEAVWLLIILLFIAAAIWMLRKETFCYTHYPIRLNRKTRMVHVFRLDGTTLSIPWDEVFFTLCHTQTNGGRFICGHVFGADALTIQETFALSYYGGMSASDLDVKNDVVGEQDYVRRYWEFVRRFMDEGPSELIRQVEFVMPISKRHEPISHSFSRFNANWGPLWIPMLPVTLLVWPFRVLAMRTCKIPQWPNEIERACQIDANDPYRRDEVRPTPTP